MHSLVPLSPVTFLERSAGAFPKKLAIVSPGGEISFSELLRRTRCLAQVLKQYKVEHGDRIAVLAENCVQSVEVHFAIPSVGAVLVMLNPWLNESDIVNLLEFSEAKILIADSDHYHKLSSVNRAQLAGKLRVLLVNQPGKVGKVKKEHGAMDYEDCLKSQDGLISLERYVKSEFDPIAINFTSGTTGAPKGVIYSHRAGYLHALGQVLMLGLNTQSSYLWSLPMFHVNGWGHMWACVAVGCTQYIPATNFNRENAAEFLAVVQEHEITHLAGAPRLIRILADVIGSENTLHGVSIVTGGAAPSPALIQRLEEMGVRFIHQYGLSETCGPFVVCEEQDEWQTLPREIRAQLRARQGKATVHAGTGLRVLDTNGKAVPQDGQTLGEVVMAGNTLALGYYKNPEATEKAFRDGWFYSGDMAVVHADGNLEIRDRIKDLIYVETEYGWENISSIEIENVLCCHEAIQDAAVVSVSEGCQITAPQLVAFVELRISEQLSEEAFHAYCRVALTSYKRPQIVFFDTLPKTQTGKLRKDILSKEATRRLGVLATERDCRGKSAYDRFSREMDSFFTGTPGF